ncbi:hypothetical protein ACP275_08G185000 [Erythranthe tilingii]
MKFFLEFVACGGSWSSADKTIIPAVQEEPQRPIGRKQGKGRGGGREWRPSLAPISEDVSTAERVNNVERTAAAAGWRRTLKRKISSVSQRDRTRSSDCDYGRRAPLPHVMPAFSPTPFMF